MQTNQQSRSRHVQSTQVRSAQSRYAPQDNRQSIIILAALCLLLPPVGVMFVWRARRMAMPLRAGLSAAGFAATTLIFWLLMRPVSTASTILPVPETPVQAGYGTVATDHYEPEPTNVPSQPDVFAADPSVTQDQAAQDPGALTDDSIVYAVTNNASSYHLYQICDLQENHRTLTLREALNEGLAPCEKCVGAVG